MKKGIVEIGVEAFKRAQKAQKAMDEITSGFTKVDGEDDYFWSEGRVYQIIKKYMEIEK